MANRTRICLSKRYGASRGIGTSIEDEESNKYFVESRGCLVLNSPMRSRPYYGLGAFDSRRWSKEAGANSMAAEEEGVG